MKKVYICEKPSLAQALAFNLGKPVKKDGYYDVDGDAVAWLKGHILELIEPDEYKEEWARSKNCYEVLPMFPEKFKKKVKSGGYGKIFSDIKALCSSADIVVNVGDPDREGQYLVDEVLEKIGWKGKTERLFINAYDDATIKRALASIEDNNSSKNHNMFRSAFCRDITDWLIGMNGSRKFSLDAGYNVVVGRVQIPILSLVYRRNLEIDNFKSVDFYKVKASHKVSDVGFSSFWKPADTDGDGFDSEGRLLKQEIAKVVADKVNGAEGVVKDVVKELKKVVQPLPYNLATLQKDACAKLGISLKELDEVMQSLYEKHKLLTYPRSDCEYIPESQYADRNAILDLLVSQSFDVSAFAQRADRSIKSRAFNDKKISAHHAIIPTSVKPDFSKLSDIEKGVYLIVALRYIVQFYKVHEYEHTKVFFECNGENFIASGSVVKEEGWKVISSKAEDKDGGDDEENKYLPSLNKGDIVPFIDAAVITSKTKPPVRFTQESLITALCNAHKYVKDNSLKDVVKDIKGLGTPATRSGTIARLLERGTLYEKNAGKKKKELYTAPEVAELINALPDELTYPDMTAIIEMDLDKVSNGEISEDEYKEKIFSYIRSLMTIKASFAPRMRKRPDNAVDCPVCKTGFLSRHEGQYGAFWSCSRYKEGCKAVFHDVKGKPAIYECPVCKKHYLKRVKDKNDNHYWSCAGYFDGSCKAIFNDIKGKPAIFECPECKKHFLKQVKSKTGKYYWSCMGYFDGSCKAIYPDENGKPAKPLPKVECPVCGKPLRRVNTKNGYFWVCPDNKVSCKSPWFADKNGKPEILKCKVCDGFLVRKTWNDKVFYGCSNYPTCKESYNVDANGKLVKSQKKKN